MKPTDKKAKSKIQSPDNEFYIGEAINTADKGKVNDDLIKERTETLNNNPRNDALNDE